MTIPEQDADIAGFVEWVENNYTDNRWSNVYQRGHTVTVWSGKYPAFGRFQQDLRPHLHAHGLVVTETRCNVPKQIDGEGEKVHWVSAVPVSLVVAEQEDMVCSRGACENIIAGAGEEYCSECGEVFKEVA